MLSHNQNKFVNALKIKKFRIQHNLFIVEGEKCVDELLNSSLVVVKVFALNSWIERNQSILVERKCEVIEITDIELKKISDLLTPNKVLAIAQIPEKPDLYAFLTQELVLALDGIRDPGNLGTIIRTANWFGINKIVCSEDSVDVFNPKVVQSSMGSFAKTQVLFMNLNDFFSNLPTSTPVYGALLDGPEITKYQFTKPGVILIGSESHGIRKEIQPFISHPVYIPHILGANSGNSTAESLNASIAASILCYEITKQLFSV